MKRILCNVFFLLTTAHFVVGLPVILTAAAVGATVVGLGTVALKIGDEISNERKLKLERCITCFTKTCKHSLNPTHICEWSKKGTTRGIGIRDGRYEHGKCQTKTVSEITEVVGERLSAPEHDWIIRMPYPPTRDLPDSMEYKDQLAQACAHVSWLKLRGATTTFMRTLPGFSNWDPNRQVGKSDSNGEKVSYVYSLFLRELYNHFFFPYSPLVRMRI